MKSLALLFLAMSMVSFATAGEGKEMFVTKKCMKCHTVESHEIQTTSKKDPSEISDLSNVAGNFENADALKAYLKKEVEHNGKKHKMKFKGEDTELQVIVDWVLTLKK